MKKFLCFAILFSLLIIQNATAESIFADASSFRLAKAVKLGRSKSGGNSTIQTIATFGDITGSTDDDDSECPSGQVYNPTIAKCVMAICPSGCNPSDDCLNGCGSCVEGHFLNYDNGMCPTCSSVIPNCTACTGTLPYNLTCTACAAGYRLRNGQCISVCTGVNCVSGYEAKAKTMPTQCCCEEPCPSNCSSCSGTTCSKCNSGYYLVNNTCEICPTNATCLGDIMFSCAPGYYKQGTSCIKCATGCAACFSTTNCTTCSDNYTLQSGSCVPDCDYWDNSRTSGCSPGYRKPLAGGLCTKCPPNTQCASCQSGCSGAKEGVCNTSGSSCLKCTTGAALSSSSDDQCTWAGSQGWAC